MAAGGFDYEKIAGEAAQKMEGHMCWPCDWYKEELPLENKEGNCLQGAVQKLLSQSMSCPKYYDAFYAGPDESQAVLPAWPAAPKATALIFADKHGICQGIVGAFPDGRVGTKKIVENMEELSQADIEDLFGPKGWDMIIFGVGMDAPASQSVADVIDQNTVLTKCFLNLCKAINRKGDRATKKLAVLTRGNFEEDPKVHKKFGLAMTTAGTLFGMCNTGRQELEDVDIQYIDTEYAPEKIEELYPKLASEIARIGSFGHSSVLINKSGRYVHRQVSSKPYEKAQKPWVMPTSGTIAILGGNGALGLVMGEWLLAKAKEQGGKSSLRIQFLSRSMKITDQNMPTWKKIQETAAGLGVEVEQLKVDVSTQDGVDEFVSGLRGEIIGIIHSAGVLQDGMLMNLTWEKCETVFDSKHRPALFLHGALERFKNPNLKFFWNFSSISVYGNVGQFNYSGSNSFLDALTRHRVARGKPSMAIQWGAWGDVGMAANMDQASTARAAASPMPFFKNSEGILGLEAGIRSNMPYFAVYKTNPAIMLGWIQPAENGASCYLRNFYSEMVPTNLPAQIEPKHYYTSIRMAYGGSYTAEGRERLCFDRHVAPLAEAQEKEWGDDFRQW